MNAVTFVPYVGATVQLLEIYALGQFALTVCSRNIDASDEAAMNEAWAAIEPTIWRADEVIAFYEGASGESFPEAARAPFKTAVDALGKLPALLNTVPGLATAQEYAGEKMRKGTALVGEGMSKLKRFFA